MCTQDARWLSALKRTGHCNSKLLVEVIGCQSGCTPLYTHVFRLKEIVQASDTRQATRAITRHTVQRSGSDMDGRGLVLSLIMEHGCALLARPRLVHILK
jgi:hypothetical protein